jgi:acetylornithine deacetylase
MKGGIATMLKAVKFIQQAGIKLNGDLKIETVPEEEITEMGTLACCQKGYKADATIIPEPINGDILVAMRGNAGGKVTVFGRAGHADELQPHWSVGGAVNAIFKSVKIIQAFEELTEEWRTRPDKQHKLLNPDIVLPTVIRGGEWSVTYPEKVEIEFNAPFIPSTVNPGKEIEEKIMSVAANDPWMKEHPPKIERNNWVYGAEIDENEPIIQTAIEASRELGIEPKLIGAGSLSDAIHLINYSKVPTISIGVDWHTAHKEDEFVDIGQLIQATKVLALSILRWCGYS